MKLGRREILRISLLNGVVLPKVAYSNKHVSADRLIDRNRRGKRKQLKVPRGKTIAQPNSLLEVAN